MRELQNLRPHRGNTTEKSAEDAIFLFLHLATSSTIFEHFDNFFSHRLTSLSENFLVEGTVTFSGAGRVVLAWIVASQAESFLEGRI